MHGTKVWYNIYRNRTGLLLRGALHNSILQAKTEVSNTGLSFVSTNEAILEELQSSAFFRTLYVPDRFKSKAIEDLV